MTALATALDRQQFVRVRRSSIVRLRAVREIRPAGHGDLVLDSGAIVRWSHLHRVPHPGRRRGLSEPMSTS